MRVRENMIASLRGRRVDHTLPGAFYHDPEIYKVDLEEIFYREWLFVGHDCEIERPGDYFTLQIGDYPVLVVRGKGGEIRAFHNSCRHRGSRICAAERGSAVRLVCPYHNWSYDLDGRLLFARDMQKPFDPQKLGLKPIACESAGGYVFVCLSPTPREFAPFRAMMEPYFRPHHFDKAKVAFQSTIIENANWKLVWENNRECYHCLPNHPELCVSFPEAPTLAGVDGAAQNAVLGAHWDRLEATGLPSRFQMSADGQYRVTRTALLGEAESYTLTGKPAVAKPLSADVVEPRIGALLLFNYPSTWNHVLGDHAVTFRVTPIGPKQTAVTTNWLVNAEAVEGVDYSLQALTEVWLATNDQDRRIVEENQIGVCSPAFEPGPYNRVHEAAVMQFVDWYARTTLKALEGRGQREVA